MATISQSAPSLRELSQTYFHYVSAENRLISAGAAYLSFRSSATWEAWKRAKLVYISAIFAEGRATA